MTPEQIVVFAVLFLALILFCTERVRYDIVALLALLAVIVAGIIPDDQAFEGFGHPAVVTVAAVLVLSRGLQNSGVVDVMARGMRCGSPRRLKSSPPRAENRTWSKRYRRGSSVCHGNDKKCLPRSKRRAPRPR